MKKLIMWIAFSGITASAALAQTPASTPAPAGKEQMKVTPAKMDHAKPVMAEKNEAAKPASKMKMDGPANKHVMENKASTRHVAKPKKAGTPVVSHQTSKPAAPASTEKK